MEPLAQYVIPLDPRSKKNAHRISGCGKRCPVCGKYARQFIRNGSTTTDYAFKAAQYLHPKPPKPITGPVHLVYKLYTQTWHRKDDLTLMKAVGVGEEDIVLDFFSGSATTGEAAFTVSAEQNKNTHFILVQWPENLDENLKRAVGSAVQVTKNAIALCDKMGRPHLLTEIGKERIRRAGEKIRSDSPLTTMDLDIGFRVLRTDSSNMNDVYYGADEYSQDLLSSLESNIKADRTELDLLFGCLLDWGLSLSEKFAMFQIDGINVYAYGMTAEEYHDYKDHMVTYQDGIQVIDCQPEKLNAPLIACFAENVPEAVIKRIAKMQPLRVVFRDSCFADSPSKINVYEIFKMLAPDTRVKVI